jgi:hypothetical protein
VREPGAATTRCGQTLVKRWSNTGQTLVKYWSNAGQTLVKLGCATIRSQQVDLG